MSKLSRENPRPETRVSVTRRGPLHIHESLKDDPNYSYRIINVSKSQPYRFTEKIEDGWTPVERTELDDLKSKYGELLEGLIPHGSYITKPINDDITGVLMKIPKDRAEQLRQAVADAADDLEREIHNEAKREKFRDVDISIGHRDD